MVYFKGNTCPKCGGAPTGMAFVDGIDQATGRRIGWTEAVCDCDYVRPPYADQGEAMRAKRRGRFSQSDIAAVLGVHPADLSKWEQGRDWPDPETVARWEAALG